MSQVREDYLVRATAHDGLIRAFAIDSTRVVGELERIHGTEPAVTAALGRLATGSLIFGAMQKQPHHAVSVRIRADGPAGTLLATANGSGEVRGLVANPRTGIEQVKENGKLNVSGVVGSTGRLTVTRDLGMRQPYVGVVELISGEVGDDLAHYLASSEQTPSAVGLGVYVDRAGTVVASGGYIVQLLPGVADRTAEEIEKTIRALPHPTTMLRDGDTPEDVLTRIFGDSHEVLERVPVRFHCPCSLDRVERALQLLGVAELTDLLEKDRGRGSSEIVCEFCGARYELSTEALAELIDRAAAGAVERANAE
jgi:molecular chaperone Hsp33